MQDADFAAERMGSWQESDPLCARRAAAEAQRCSMSAPPAPRDFRRSIRRDLN